MFLVQKAIQSHHFRSPVTKPPHISKPNPNLLTPQLLDQNTIHHLKTLDLASNSSTISLISLSEAVTFLSKLHSEAEAQINQDLYMDYSLKVLDLCNLISSEVNQLTNQRILINYSVRLLELSGQSPLPVTEKLIKAKDALTRFVAGEASETEKGLRAKALIEELIVLIDNLPNGNGNGNGIDLVRRMFYATVFVGSVLVTVLFGVDLVNGELDRIIDWVKVKRNAVLEVDDVSRQAVVVRDLVEAVVDGGGDEGAQVRLENGVKDMVVKAKRFSDGVDALTNGVNGLFRTVLKIRDTCLDV